MLEHSLEHNQWRLGQKSVSFDRYADKLAFLPGKASLQCVHCSGPCKKNGHFKNKNRLVQRYFCSTCKRSFSEPQPFDRLRLETSKVVQIVKFLGEGLGIRATSRLLGIHAATVLNVLKVTGKKLSKFLDKTVRNVNVEWGIQLDEIWSRVGIRQSRALPSDTERGDIYLYLGLCARTKLLVSFHVGKRNYNNADIFTKDLASRIHGRFQVTTDSWRPYPGVVRKHLLGRIDFATVKKRFAMLPWEKDSERRYSPGPFIGITKRIRAGAPDASRISTSLIERANLTVRHFIKRFNRLGLGWSRKFENHCCAIALFIATYNFVKIHSTIGCTPAVGAKLAFHNWTVKELLETATRR